MLFGHDQHTLAGSEHNGQQDQTQAAPPDPYDTLTGREREVLQLPAEGQTNNKASACLSISPRTVEVHCADPIRLAIKRGILPLGG